MIVPPGPYRLELNDELFGHYPTLQGMKQAITKRLDKGDNPGFFKGLDARGCLLMTHTGLCFQDFSLNAAHRPRPKLKGPVVKLMKANPA